MFRVAFKGLLGHKLRFALTAFAVVLGVTFVSGALVLTDSMEEAFGGLLETAYEGTDVHITAASPFDDFTTQQPGTGATLDAALLDVVAEVDGVADAGGLVEGVARVIGPDGDELGTPGAPTFGFSWSDDGSVTLRNGRAPTGSGEVALDAVTMESGGFAVGDEVRIALPTGLDTFAIVGVTGFGDSDNLLGATIASFDLETARALFDKEGRFDGIFATAAPGVDVDALSDRIAEVMPAGVEVGTTADRVEADRASIGQALGFFNTALLAFAGVALFVGAFIIANTFSIVVAQRQREFALLRAVGASGRQVRLAVVVEALVLGVVASTIGLLAGVGFASVLQALLGSFGIALPSSSAVVAPGTIVASYVVGVGVTVLASLGPARRASRVAPVEAMRGAAAGDVDPSRRRTLAGAGLASVGAVLMFVGLATSVANAIAFVGAGALVVLLGVAMLAPAVADPFARVVGRLPARLGITGVLARGNARRNPRRTAATASALMIGLALVSFVTILASSIRATVSDLLTEQFRADFIITADSFGMTPLSDDVVAELTGAEAIGTTAGLRWTQAKAGDDRIGLVAMNAGTLEEVTDIQVAAGSLAGLGSDAVMVHTDELDSRELAVGDDLALTFASGEQATLEIVGTFEAKELLGAPYLIADQTLDAYVEGVRPTVLLATAAGDLDAARGVVDEVEASYPIQAEDQAEFRERQDQQVGQILGLMMVLLALAIIIALLGIANTLALSVFERTREVGLLRAVGMTRRQVRRMVLWESMIIAVFGAVLGLVVGTGFGWAVVTALESEGIDRLVIPGGQLALYVGVAAVAGALAALFPARRAAKLDVLAAVTAE